MMHPALELILWGIVYFAGLSMGIFIWEGVKYYLDKRKRNEWMRQKKQKEHNGNGS